MTVSWSRRNEPGEAVAPQPRVRPLSRNIVKGGPIVSPRIPIRPWLPLICVVAIGWPSVLDAGATTAGSPARPRIGLALSGGGARGAAHIGVLRVLEEHRVPVDFIAGTSMGALVGGLYASGLSPAQLDSVISDLDWMEAFADRIPRRDRSFHRKRDDDLFLVKSKPGLRGSHLQFPPGLLDGQRVDLLLKRLTLPAYTVRDFDDLGIPYRAVGADIVNGEAVVLGHGDLAMAMRASMSIPTAFAPREIDGRLLVDGGITDNLPIDLVRRMGADVVIAVDISTPPQGREGLYSVIAITTQLATLASEQNKQRQIASLGPRDVFIQPDLGSITVASFDRAAEAIPIGQRAAEAALGKLERLAVSAEEYRDYQATRAARAATGGPPAVDALRIVNHSRLADDVISARLGAPIGGPIDVGLLEQGLEQIYGLELFESVYYDIVPGPQGNVLTVTARERAWGPNYLQGGIAVFDDFEGPNFNIAFAYSRTAVNHLNGEWRTGLQFGQEPGAWTEIYQPLDRRLRTFADLELSAVDRTLNVFAGNGDKLSELGITHFGGTLAGGREIGTWAELRAGVTRERGRIRVQVGAPGPAATRFDTGEAFVQFYVDKLDEVAFPHRGESLRVRGSAGLGALGSDVEYRQATVDGTCAGTGGRYTAVLGGSLATTQSGTAPLQSCFRLGGLAQLSGLEQDELVGQHALLMRAMLYRRLVDLELLPVYAGVSAEYGNVFQTRAEIGLERGIAAGSVLLGADTPIGPLCVAYGLAERGRGNYYMTLGQPLGARRPGFRIR
jgi:NTE family protein